jgi:hypothetical protein
MTVTMQYIMLCSMWRKKDCGEEEEEDDDDYDDRNIQL